MEIGSFVGGRQQQQQQHQVKVHAYLVEETGSSRVREIWLSSVLVHGREYLFSQAGVESCKQRGTLLGEPTRIESLGPTEISYELFLDFVIALGESAFSTSNFDVVGNGFNAFTSEVCLFLCGAALPEYIQTPKDLTQEELACLAPILAAKSLVDPEVGGAISFARPQRGAGAAAAGASAAGASAAAAAEVSEEQLIREEQLLFRSLGRQQRREDSPELDELDAEIEALRLHNQTVQKKREEQLQREEEEEQLELEKEREKVKFQQLLQLQKQEEEEEKKKLSAAASTAGPKKKKVSKTDHKEKKRRPKVKACVSDSNIPSKQEDNSSSSSSSRQQPLQRSATTGDSSGSNSSSAKESSIKKRVSFREVPEDIPVTQEAQQEYEDDEDDLNSLEGAVPTNKDSSGQQNRPPPGLHVITNSDFDLHFPASVDLPQLTKVEVEVTKDKEEEVFTPTEFDLNCRNQKISLLDSENPDLAADQLIETSGEAGQILKPAIVNGEDSVLTEEEPAEAVASPELREVEDIRAEESVIEAGEKITGEADTTKVAEEDYKESTSAEDKVTEHSEGDSESQSLQEQQQRQDRSREFAEQIERIKAEMSEGEGGASGNAPPTPAAQQQEGGEGGGAAEGGGGRKKEQKPSEPPVTFREFDHVSDFEDLVRTIVTLVDQEGQDRLREMEDWIVKNEGTWVLAEGFNGFLGRVLHDKNLPSEGRVAMLRLLAYGAGQDDIVLVMHSDRKEHLIMNYAQEFDRLPIREQEATALFFANLFENNSSSEWLLYISEWQKQGGGLELSNIRVTTKVAVNALLGDTPALVDYGTAIMHNLATKEVFDDICTELAMAVLQFFSTGSPSEEHCFRCLKALAKFSAIAHRDVPQLIKMIGPEPIKFRGKSARCDQVIEAIQARLATVPGM